MIIVTGGAGFIGSNLVRGLNQRGQDDIVIVDDLENGEKHLGLNALRFSDFIDYRDFLGRLHELPTPTAIFHQGACSDTMERDGRVMMRVNYEYSKSLLEFAQGRCPFFYASSASVYGNGDRGFREVRSCEYPLNVYAFSKFLFDQYVRQVLQKSETQVVGLRYFNVFGPQENHKGRMASVIYKFHQQIQEQGHLQVFEGSDDFRRDFVYVEDAVAMNLFFLDHPDKSGIFNCGTGRAESFLELANQCAKHYEGAEVGTIPFPTELRGKYQSYTRADHAKLLAVGYDREFTSLADGVAGYVKLLKASDGYFMDPVKA